ncbi:MAG: hypothetical protein AB8B61_08270 [Cyclobacteriaceae bacterium]
MTKSILNNFLTQEYSFISEYNNEELLNNILQNKKIEKDYRISIINKSDNHYTIKANSSLGVGMANGLGQSIQIELRFKKVAKQTQVRVFTKPRIDLTLILILLPIITVLVGFASQSITEGLYVLVLFLTLFFWFRLIYRGQEKTLVDNAKSFLKLKSIRD